MNKSYKSLGANEALMILTNNNICHVALSNNNLPYQATMNYTVNRIDDINGIIYYINLSSLKNTKKMKYLTINSHANILIEEYNPSGILSAMCFATVKNVDNDKDSCFCNIVVKVDYITGRAIINNKQGV